MEDFGTVLLNKRNLLFVQPDAVGKAGVAAEDTDRIEEFHIAHAASLLNRIHLAAALRGMRMEEHAREVPRHCIRFAQERIGAGEDEPGRHGIEESPIGFPVPCFGLVQRRANSICGRFPQGRI